VLRLLALSSSVIIAFVLLVFAARLLGEAQPPPEAIHTLHLDVCMLPCWNGIMLGQTLLDDAFQRMSSQYAQASLISITGGAVIKARYASDTVSGWFDVYAKSDGIVQSVRIHVKTSNQFILGDIITLYGVPTDTISLFPRIIAYNCETLSVSIGSNAYYTKGWQQPVTTLNISYASVELPPCPAQIK
jgi:hypothetical protein